MSVHKINLRLSIILAAVLLLSGCGASRPAALPSASAANAPIAAITEKPPQTPNPTVESTPKPTPKPTPEPSEAEKLLADMTLEEKVGQLFFAGLRSGETGDLTEMNDELLSLVEDYHIGGFVLFSQNIAEEDQTKKLISDMKELADVPLFVAIDEEGGTVTRTASLGYETVPDAAEIGALGSAAAEVYGYKIGTYLSALGVNLDFAPVADINTNPGNPVIGRRAFSSDPALASEMVSAFSSGLHRGGVMSCLKHFPGHGDTQTDSHYGAASVSHDIERLRSAELLPFKAGIDAGAEFVMVGHISAPNVTGDDEPAIFSPYLLNDILRGELGFSGIAVTDGMEMGAVTEKWTAGEAALKSIQAGMDMICLPADFYDAYDTLLSAAKDGTLNADRLDEAVLRILEIKSNLS